jgi:hypothetical protein
MKYLQILTIVSSILFSSLGFAEQDVSSSEVTPIKEITINELDFDHLPQESTVGDLAEHVKESGTLMENFLDYIRIKGILQPYAEGLAYVNGVLCHVGNYPQSVIYTVLEGHHYGLQTTTDTNGFVLYVNYDYSEKYTPYGVVLKHRYSDSKVVTGSNQVIVFR